MTSDVLVIGGGVLGLAVALAIRERFPDQSVTVLEKDRCGAHASGRNSGVLHAGFYYGEDSLKARFSVEGARRMAAWCEARGLPLRRCGKLVVARTEADHAGLDELERRAGQNGVEVQVISASEARRIEPRVKTVGRAIFSPSTASVDPGAVMASLADAARDAGIVLAEGEAYRGRDGDGVWTNRGHRSCGFLVNTAGLYADRIAADFGFGLDYGIVPFKGLYLCGQADAGSQASHVYPVPDLDMPFLGVHFTVTTSGGLKIGPTATPAFWREHYGGVRGFSGAEALDIGLRQSKMWWQSGMFRRLALRELRKLRRATLVHEASQLVEGVQLADYRRWGRPGIRAQLVERRTSRWILDFVVEGDARSIHVLNGISPGFTCSLPFADWIAGRIP